MTSVTPKPGLFLDDGTGTYPIDITSRVSLSQGVSIQNHGRTDEFGTAFSATFSCTLKNDDGAIGSGSVAIAPGTGIRWIETMPAVAGTAVNRFTGKVDSLELSWDGGVAKSSRVAVTAVDKLAELARRPLRSMLEQEVLVDSPSAYYTLGEPEGAITAVDSSGSQAPPLSLAGTGAAVVFGNGVGPTDGLTAAQFFGGQYLSGSNGTWLAASSGNAIECFFTTTTTPPSSSAILVQADVGSNAAQTYLAVNNSGRLEGFTGSSLISGGPSVADGLVHHAMMTLDGAGNQAIYLDGVNLATFAGVALRGFPATRFSVAPSDLGTAAFAGTISHAATYNSAPSAGRVASHALVLTGFPEDTAARLTRLASYVGTTATTTAGSGQLVAAQVTSSQSALDAMQDVATAEGGVFFVNGTGNLVMQGRNYRAGKVTPTLTVASKDVGADSAFPRDTLYVINSCTVTHSGGGEQLVQDPSATSSTGPGMFPTTLDLIVPDDASALYAAQWQVGKHLTSIPRIGAVTIRLLTTTSALTFLQAEIGDRWTLSGMPSQNWAGTGDYTVEGWTETLTVSDTTAEWSLVVNLIPWSLNQVWILGDTTYGVLGSTTILGY